MRETSAHQSRKPVFLPCLALLLGLASISLAQEATELGRMWTFENPPLAYLEKEYGFTPDPEWLDALRLGSLRLGGEDVLSGVGSAAFVSPRGLILTSHRCVRDAVAATLDAAGPSRDGNPLGILKTGFVAAAPEEEIRLRSRRDEWLTAAQLVRISDVTDEVNRGMTGTDDELQRREKRKANEESILDAAKKVDPELVPQIVSVHQGVSFQLYQYKAYADVRLVCIPHLQAAHFGGDPDNFTYPRYSIDFAFLRAYEGGKPADTTKHHFEWKPGGAEKGELVFVSGNPGTTKRWLTKAQTELERDIRIPIEIARLTSALRIWKDPRSATYSGEYDPENPSRYWAFVRTRILGLQDDLKAAHGHLRGLENASRMAQKTAAEQAFRDRVMVDEELAERYGDLWDRIAGVVQERRQLEARARFQTAGGSAVLDVAIAIVRLCDPAETEEHRERARETVESRAGGTINSNFHMTAQSLDHFVRSRDWLPEDDPLFTNVLGGRSPEEFLEAMEGERARSSPDWPGYPESREALVAGGWQAIQDSEDPVIVAARELVVSMRQNEKLVAELDAKEEALGAEIALALSACYGTEVGPDGTTTLRFSDGVVSGFPSGGTIAPHRTTFYGLYARNAEFAGQHPFNLPRIWLDREDEIDMTKSLDFVSTNDIAAGGSGSVVVNKELEVVGVVVDGNTESLHNDFVFRDDVPRAVSVHVDGIVEALVKIYDAHHVAEELTGR